MRVTCFCQSEPCVKPGLQKPVSHSVQTCRITSLPDQLEIKSFRKKQGPDAFLKLPGNEVRV
jgi:hypothetical protein